MKLSGSWQSALWAVLFALLLAAPVLGRKKPPNQQSPGALRVTTRLVQIDVIVKDQHGRLVGGLTSHDFRVFDDGKPQTISIFRVEETQPTARPARLPPGVYSNLPERQVGSSPAVTVILLDSLNTALSDQAYARLQVVKFLQQLRPGDLVALYALGSELRVLHDFTTDAPALKQALAGYRSDAPIWVTASKTPVPPASKSGIGGTGSSQPPAAFEYFLKQRIEMTTNALEAIANYLEGFPGRKNLIWISSSFPMLWRGHGRALLPGLMSPAEMQSYSPEISRATLALDNANLAIYPVDPRGVFGHFDENIDTMIDLAKRTGGQAFYNTNDIQHAIRQVVDDTRLTYVLGYYPEHIQWNGKFRKIRVVVDHPGLKLQYRDGYSAVAETGVPASQGPLDAALRSPFDATGVGLTAMVAPGEPPSASPETVRITLRVDPRDITLTPKGDYPAASLTVMVAQFGAKGQNLGGIRQHITFRVVPQRKSSFLSQGLTYSLSLKLAPQAERVRVVVRDDSSGAIGSLNVDPIVALRYE